MNRRIAPAFVVVVAASTSGLAALAACTLTQSLDYLQQGGGDGAAGSDAGPDSPVDTDGGSRKGEVIVPNQTKPDFLAQDSLNLYWATAGTIRSVPKAGGTPRTLGVAPSVKFLAADPDPNGFVFVAAGRDVYRFPKDGSDGGVVFSAPAASPAVDTVLADQSALFVLQADDVEELSLVRKMAKDGTAQVDLAGDGGLATVMAQEKDTLFWMDSTLDPTTFYELAKSAPPGTPPTSFPLVVDDEYPVLSAEVAADATTLYWASTNTNDGAPLIISRLRQKGAPTVTLYRGKADGILGGITIDDTFVYAVDKKGGAILRVPKSGTGMGEVVLDGLSGPTSLVVDATTVYATVEAIGAMGSIVKRQK